MIGSDERKAASKGANHDEISPAVGLPKRRNEPDRISPQAEIIKVHNIGPSHLNVCGLPPEFRVATINRAVISYPEA